MKRLFCAFALVLLLVGSAFALSDADYKILRKNSPEFLQADRELSQVWDDLKDVLSGREFDKLRKEQRQWIKSGRDKAARKLMRDEGYTFEEAYTEATRARVETLKKYY